MRVAFVAPEKVIITDDNFADYLGNDQYVLAIFPFLADISV